MTKIALLSPLYATQMLSLPAKLSKPELFESSATRKIGAGSYGTAWMAQFQNDPSKGNVVIKRVRYHPSA